jgi:hypothetical protein
MDDRAAYILDLLRERGPMSDDSLATEVVGDQGSANEVSPITQKLLADGLIAPSQFAKDRWEITDAGRRARGDEPGR